MSASTTLDHNIVGHTLLASPTEGDDAARLWQEQSGMPMAAIHGDAVTLVDTGYPGDRARLLSSLDRISRSVTDVAAVVLTHGHPDHIGSAEYLRASLGSAFGYMSERRRTPAATTLSR